MKRQPDNRLPASVHESTWAVHGGNTIDQGTGALRTPLIMANSYLLPEDPSTMNWSNAAGLVYTRNSGANQQALETKLAALEGGEAAALFRDRCRRPARNVLDTAQIRRPYRRIQRDL